MSDAVDDSDTGVPSETERQDESTLIANDERRRNMSAISGIAAILGAWVALSVLIYDVGEATLWNNVLIGAVVFLAAGYNFYRLNNDIPLSVGVSALVAVLGIWLIVATAVFGMAAGAFWSTAISGLLIALLSGYNAYEAREAETVVTEGEAEPP
ncbi:SPW repeat domain-containing protein [Natrialbaceae archaeon AArc-T1-2]|uniref:SPW repeat domain-containing protein n=1 Tax=Natrialbaceae archaeon AArc-T1-2 TaxID=3053904 RepID=UPI00255AF609|nr:hypothetical protein [Natrialbaceae archaeon AArc-T1-2]WIV67461.1 hypothetical protein QQ977_01660 [Natrialbaceae archaeon AArc-T1-2]